MWEAVRPAWAAMSRKTGTGVVSLGAGDFFFFSMRTGGIFVGGAIGPCAGVWVESNLAQAIVKNNDRMVIRPACMQCDCSADHGSSRGIMAAVNSVFTTLRYLLEDKLQR